MAGGAEDATLGIGSIEGTAGGGALMSVGISAYCGSSGCSPTLQHISTSTYGAKERSYTRGLIQDIRGFLLWPSSFDYDLSSLL